ncbi:MULTISPECIES: Fic family protein [unclassified Streptomyces]|uniref:Fic family protein n=1 Tax=unclassified Streptomyces TaxID=2593676 RepID=UPI002D2187BF|nr:MULTISPECIES: Fic family protein [unclassified Streptomyces]
MVGDLELTVQASRRAGRGRRSPKPFRPEATPQTARSRQGRPGTLRHRRRHPRPPRRLPHPTRQEHHPALPLTARAARAYLDICFFHPFDDGNARAALLTLLFVLARESVALDSVRS